MRLMRVRVYLLMWFVFPASFAVAQRTDLAEVCFIPQWVPQAQFAGYYVAHEKGFYQKFNLKVNILRGGPEWSSSECLEKGRADFVTMFLTTGIVKRALGVKLVNIGQIVQRSALMLVAKKSSGIHAPEDLQGKKVGLWGDDFRIQPRAFFQRYNISVNIIPQTTSLNLFLRGGVDAASAMWYNEYHMILNAGLDADELTTFFLSDHGMNFPEDGIYCMEDTFREDPELCCYFVRASIEGWKYAFAHPEEALDIVMKFVVAANVPTNRVHQKWMLERMKDIILPREKDTPMGGLPAQSYDQVALELKKNGLIDNIPAFRNFFVSCVSDVEK